MGCAVGGECIAQPAGVRRGCVGERKCSGRACRCAGVDEGLRRGMRCAVCGHASRSLRASGLRGRASARGGSEEVFGEGVSLCGGERKSSAGSELCGWRGMHRASCGRGSGLRGRAKVFGGEWVVRSAGLTHFRRSSSRARVLLYIRPPVHVVKSQPWDRKGVPAFTLPLHRLPLPPQSNRHPAAAVIHNGLSTEKLSTSLPAALCKTFSPSRLRTRIIIYRSPVGRSRGVSAPLRKRVRAVVAPCSASPCAGWGRAKAKADAPSRSAEPCRLCVESLCAKAEVHQANPAPARALSPRQLVYGRAPAH